MTYSNPGTTLRHETLFVLGCKNARNKTTENDAVTAIYGEFTDKNVKRVDGVQMTYWLNQQMGCVDTSDLLGSADGNGNCQSWAGLFRDMIRVQGIQADRKRVWPKAPDTSVVVKTWKFTDPPHGPVNHPYLVGIDASDEPGVEAQGNANPPGSFNGHWITQIGSTLYDPSYGSSPVSGADNLEDYENGAFEGFGAEYSAGSGQIVTGIRKNNTNASASAEVDINDAN